MAIVVCLPELVFLDRRSDGLSTVDGIMFLVRLGEISMTELPVPLVLIWCGSTLSCGAGAGDDPTLLPLEGTMSLSLTATDSLVLIRECSALSVGARCSDKSGWVSSPEGSSAGVSGGVAGLESLGLPLPFLFFFSSFSIPRSPQRPPFQAASSIWSPP